MVALLWLTNHNTPTHHHRNRWCSSCSGYKLWVHHPQGVLDILRLRRSNTSLSPPSPKPAGSGAGATEQSLFWAPPSYLCCTSGSPSHLCYTNIFPQYGAAATPIPTDANPSKDGITKPVLPTDPAHHPIPSNTGAGKTKKGVVYEESDAVDKTSSPRI